LAQRPSNHSTQENHDDSIQIVNFPIPPYDKGELEHNKTKIT
jgi:hypothetical protein